jgi:alcohol-forming fatty acyl-CoA reductase
VLYLQGNKPFFVRLNKRMAKSMSALEYFATRQWHWSDSNTRALFNSLSVTEQEKFNFDINQLDWPLYLDNYVLGTRKYVMNFSNDSIRSSRTKLKWMCRLHYMTCSFVCVFVAVWLGYLISGFLL